MITVALAGLGKMGLSHLSIIRPHPLVESIAVCDPSAPFLGVLAGRTDVATFTDYERMLDEARPDAVVIATPSFLHADMVRAALSRDIHVFCEKPLFLDTADGVELTAVAAERRLVTQVGYHNRFVGTFAEAKRLLELGAIGTVTKALAEAYGPVVTKPTKGGWRDQRAAGGGCLYDYAAHPVDLLTWYFGPVVRASGSRLDGVFSTQVDDTVSSTLEFGSGTSAQLSVNWSDESQRKMTTSVTLWGTKGRIKVDRQEIQVFLRPGAEVPQGYTDGWNVRYTTELMPAPWFYVRGEEYSHQIDTFVRRVEAARASAPGTGAGLEGVNTFASASVTDEALAKILADSRGESTENQTRPAPRRVAPAAPKRGLLGGLRRALLRAVLAAPRSRARRAAPPASPAARPSAPAPIAPVTPTDTASTTLAAVTPIAPAADTPTATTTQGGTR
ncbi:putative dehydrogenase [Kineosphaera limosa]|uniref:Myo-inositol 2-dehydrogenase n=1 Tax=Kineosphaera limosa NBRC 100340 TaxID=1184609 RepID=K6WPH0_9MICO|nr:Gfo/Idh/MocA family oxidoreductase [Kineosphaera limosa]NYE02180.1 putative dehydrogenase [Kineosphaera limosa]GAB94032.1 myo-inositol 2-dehydrogenase [Kineosphaera limosa NBRC 100340]